MKEKSLEFYFDKNGIMHEKISLEIIFGTEFERDEYREACLNGEIKRVIKCENCKNWQSNAMQWHRCKITGAEMKYDDFCSRGDRK